MQMRMLMRAAANRIEVANGLVSCVGREEEGRRIRRVSVLAGWCR